ncbi:MAG: CotH kinase family protein [Chitinivibrionia bacterium]|nr:CotH kinase family protein [Chitinivibrionia bacterium]
MGKQIKILAAIVFIVGGVWANGTVAGAASEFAGRLLIFQAGAAGSDGAIGRSFVELYNNTGEEIDLDGFSLHVANGRTSNNSWTQYRDAGGEWVKIDLSGTIQPNHSYLVVFNKVSNTINQRFAFEDTEADNAVPATVLHALSNRSFKVALMANQNYLTVANPFDMGNGETAEDFVDLLGVINTAPGDAVDAYEASPAIVISQQATARRRSLTDTDDNSIDFERVDFRLAQGMTDERLQSHRPRSTSDGAWEPFPQAPDPDPIPLIERDELAGKLLIFQAFGTGATSNNDRAATHSFVELFNASDDEIDLDDITLFYAEGTGAWSAIPLSGTIPAQTSFLILGARNHSNAAMPLQIQDNSGDINNPSFILNNRALRIALFRGKTELTVQNPFTDGEKDDGLIDLLGSRNANSDLLNAYIVAPPRNSGSAGVRRVSFDVSTNNFTDFAETRYGDFNASQLSIIRPKNLAHGEWNPFPPMDIPTMITDFRISFEALGWNEYGHLDLNNNVEIDNYAHTITITTQRWIPNITNIAPIFTTDNPHGTIFVNGQPQVSGITPHDFRHPVIYQVGDFEYTVRFASPQATGLPVIRIDTHNGAAIHHSSANIWTTMRFSLSDPNDPANDIAAISNQQIRGRGNSTWQSGNNKNPYRMRFRDNERQSPFGLPEARNWVLLANWFDASLIRTSFAFEMGYRLGLECTPSFNHTELFLNGTYAGSYLFTEHRQANPYGRDGVRGRPLIDTQNGGWFVELDFRFDTSPTGDAGFRTSNYNLPVLIKSPDFPTGVIPNSVDNFVRNDWNQLTDLMASDNFPENGYRDLVDIDSWIKYFLVQVFANNADFNVQTYDSRENPGSIFIHKNNYSSLIKAGPLWDFDLSFGSFFNGLPNSLAANRLPYPNYPFFNRFLQDPVFRARYKEIWNENREWIQEDMSKFIDSMAIEVARSAEQDDIRYNRINRYSNEIPRMRLYFTERFAFLDETYNRIDAFPASRNFGTVAWNNYSDIAAQTFTFVAYGEMKDLTATFQNGDNSAFEITTTLATTPSQTGNGYFATISVRPKNSLSANNHTDVLVLSGENQGKEFSVNVSLSFVVNKASVAKPALVANQFIYDSDPKTVALTPVNTELYTLGGDTEKTAIGNFTAIVSLVDPINRRWSGETHSEPLNLPWSIICEHDFVRKTTLEANCERAGAGHYECSVCGAKKAESDFVIPMLSEGDCLPNSIRDREQQNNQFGIFVEENPVSSNFAEIFVITPEAATVNLSILDNLGNVVFAETVVGAGFARHENRTNGDLGGQTPPLQNAIVWNLTNQSGRFVANGTYLIVVEATGVSGRRFTYSTRIGVNR